MGIQGENPVAGAVLNQAQQKWLPILEHVDRVRDGQGTGQGAFEEIGRAHVGRDGGFVPEDDSGNGGGAGVKVSEVHFFTSDQR